MSLALVGFVVVPFGLVELAVVVVAVQAVLIISLNVAQFASGLMAVVVAVVEFAFVVVVAVGVAVVAAVEFDAVFEALEAAANIAAEDLWVKAICVGPF